MIETPAKILVIDDELDNFDVIEALLNPEGYDLTYVSSGQQALSLLETFHPQLILLDVMMPEMNGIEFCQHLKSKSWGRYIPIIIVTALTAKEDLAKCLEVGADDFISKPVNGLELRSRVRSLLRIKHQYDALQETLALREDLSRMLVHDLRNPLSGILLAAEILRRAEYSPKRQQQKTTEIIMAGQQLQSMIDSLLIMAKLESGKMILQKNQIDLSMLCSLALSNIEPLAEQKNLALIREFPEPGNSITGDVNLLKRVLDNLLSNAIKFAPPESQILLKADYSEPGQAVIQVMDSGPGVPEELQRNIFDKYEIGMLIKDVPQIGLGLAFCKMAVEAHGGKITVENRRPAGAVFTVSLG